METLRMDLRHGLRRLRQSPGFTLAAVSILGLGIGASTAMFSVVNTVLLRPLPYKDSDRLVVVWAKAGGSNLAASWPELLDWKERSRSFSEMSCWRGQSVNVTGDGEPDRITGSFVCASFLPLLGAKPELGRTFTPDEADPATARPVAVISHGLWQRRFGGDPRVLGKSLVLNGNPHTVVGVLGPEFAPDRAAFGGWFMSSDVLLPIAYFPNKDGLKRGQSEIMVIGRLADGVTLAGARSELGVVAQALEKEQPETQAGRGIELIPLQEQIVGDSRAPLLVLLAAVLLVLLIACANVANLLLVRAGRRRGEVALRTALGAARWRLVRHLLTEAALLSGAGCLLGLLLAAWGAQSLVWLLPSGVVPGEIPVDARVLAFAVGLSLLTGLVFGLAPALRASRTSLTEALQEGGRGAEGRHRLRDLLVVSETALALVLLAGAGLMLRSLLAMQRADPGFRTERLLTLSFRLPPNRYATPEKIASFFRAVLPRVEQIPGVESATIARAVPFSGNGGNESYEAEGQPGVPGQEPRVQTNIVSSEYFGTLGIPVLRGRAFGPEDGPSSTPVVMVNATLARKTWPGAEALGKRLRFNGSERWHTVIGVVGDAKHFRLSEPQAAQAYTTHEQDPRIFACLLVRTAGDPMAAAPAVRQAVWSVDADQPMWSVYSMEALLAQSRGDGRALASLLAVFGAVALLLASMGVHGVMSAVVAQRTREIGVRMALGARAADVMGLVVRQSGRLAFLGVALGAAGAATLSRLLRGLLFGVGPGDPLTLVVVSLILGAATLLASVLPARRAARLDPVAALRHE
jgi:putative ABC transport system permease protein